MTPIQIAAIALAIGTALGLAFKLDLFYMMPILLLGLALWIFPNKRKIPLFCIFFIALGCITASLHTEQIQPLPNSGMSFNVSGNVSSIIEKTDTRTVFDIDIETNSPQPLGQTTARCYTEPQNELEIGYTVTFLAQTVRPRSSTNPGQFSFSDYLESQSISGLLFSNQSPKIISKNSNFKALGANIRNKIYETYENALPERYAHMLDSLVFGRNEIPTDMEQNFIRTGTSHVLAASGFNVTIMAYAALMVILWATGNRRVALVAAIFVVFFYAYVAGFSASVTRALVMALLSLGAGLVGRRYSAGSGLAAAVIVLLLYRPHWLFEPGFQLSFISSLVFFVITPQIEHVVKIRSWYTKPLVLVFQTTAIQIFSLPILAYHFSTFSIVSPVANLAVIPLAEIITPTGALSGFFGLFAKPLGLVLSWLILPLLVVMDKFLAFLANPSWVLISIAPMPLLVFIFYYLTTTVLFITFSPPKWFKPILKPLLIALLAMLVSFTTGAFIGSSQDNRARVTFLDVGHGDACFIRTSKGRTMLVDGGGISLSNSYDPGERIVLPFLRQLGVNNLDYLVASHRDQDHIGGLVAVMKEMRIGMVIESGIKSNIFKSNDFDQIMVEQDIKVIIPKIGEMLNLDESSKIIFLGPPEFNLGKTSDVTNNGSVVLNIELDGIKILLTGDLQSEGMRYELQTPSLLDADIVKLPHHGGYSQGEADWFEAISPKIAINSNSVNKDFTAHEEIERICSHMNVPLLSTARLGAITFWIKNGQYSTSTFLK